MSDRTASPHFNPAYVGPRPDILALLPAQVQTVLDVGCSDGTLGESIKLARPGTTVVGMEVMPEMGQAAAQRLDQVLIGDIEAEAALAPLGQQRFDAVIFADVLEHLRDPWRMLRNIQPYLQPQGVIIASIPNIRHIDTLFNLVCKGVWPYRDRGIHDRTHLRFFTRRNIVEMFEGEALQIDQLGAHYRLIERPHRLNRYARYFALPGIAPFIAFQYLLVAHPRQSPAGPHTGQSGRAH